MVGYGEGQVTRIADPIARAPHVDAVDDLISQ